MPEPTMSTTTATLAAATAAVPVLTLAGVPLGLRTDVLVAGFAGSLVAIILLNSVPGDATNWRGWLRTTGRRLAVALASSLTAGYLTPLAMLVAHVPEPLLLGAAFAVGGGAQRVLTAMIARLSPPGPAAQEGRA